MRMIYGVLLLASLAIAPGALAGVGDEVAADASSAAINTALSDTAPPVRTDLRPPLTDIVAPDEQAGSVDGEEPLCDGVAGIQDALQVLVAANRCVRPTRGSRDSGLWQAARLAYCSCITSLVNSAPELQRSAQESYEHMQGLIYQARLRAIFTDYSNLIRTLRNGPDGEELSVKQQIQQRGLNSCNPGTLLRKISQNTIVCDPAGSHSNYLSTLKTILGIQPNQELSALSDDNYYDKFDAASNERRIYRDREGRRGVMACMAPSQITALSFLYEKLGPAPDQRPGYVGHLVTQTFPAAELPAHTQELVSNFSIEAFNRLGRLVDIFPGLKERVHSLSTQIDQAEGQEKLSLIATRRQLLQELRTFTSILLNENTPEFRINPTTRRLVDPRSAFARLRSMVAPMNSRLSQTMSTEFNNYANEQCNQIANSLTRACSFQSSDLSQKVLRYSTWAARDNATWATSPSHQRISPFEDCGRPDEDVGRCLGYNKMICEGDAARARANPDATRRPRGAEESPLTASMAHELQTREFETMVVQDACQNFNRFIAEDRCSGQAQERDRAPAGSTARSEAEQRYIECASSDGFDGNQQYLAFLNRNNIRVESDETASAARYPTERAAPGGCSSCLSSSGRPIMTQAERRAAMTAGIARALAEGDQRVVSSGRSATDVLSRAFSQMGMTPGMGIARTSSATILNPAVAEAADRDPEVRRIAERVQTATEEVARLSDPANGGADANSEAIRRLTDEIRGLRSAYDARIADLTRTIETRDAAIAADRDRARAGSDQSDGEATGERRVADRRPASTGVDLGGGGGGFATGGGAGRADALDSARSSSQSVATTIGGGSAARAGIQALNEVPETSRRDLTLNVQGRQYSSEDVKTIRVPNVQTASDADILAAINAQGTAIGINPGEKGLVEIWDGSQSRLIEVQLDSNGVAQQIIPIQGEDAEEIVAAIERNASLRDLMRTLQSRGVN